MREISADIKEEISCGTNAVNEEIHTGDKKRFKIKGQFVVINCFKYCYVAKKPNQAYSIINMKVFLNELFIYYSLVNSILIV